MPADTNTLPVNFQTEQTELQPDLQLKENFASASSPDFHKLSLFPARNTPHFPIATHSCHHCLVVPTWMNSCFQGRSTGGVKPHHRPQPAPGELHPPPWLPHPTGFGFSLPSFCRWLNLKIKIKIKVKISFVTCVHKPYSSAGLLQK